MLAPLLSACVGGLIAIMGSGSVIGQRLQASSARRFRAEEHDREDRYRLQRERMEIYSQFYLRMKVLRRTAMKFGPDTRETDGATAEARDSVWEVYATMCLLGSPEVVVAARSMILHIAAAASRDEFDLDHWSTLVAVYRTAARHDLIGSYQDDPPELHGEAEWAQAKSKGLL